VIVHYLGQTDPLTEDERNTFRSCAEYFGHLWTITMPPSQSPPKLHMLVSHAPDQMDLWHVMGLFSEDPIEREHNIVNKSNRTLKCLRTFQRRSVTQHKNSSKAANPVVQQVIANTMAVTARKSGEKTTARKLAKEEKDEDVKRRRVRKVGASMTEFEVGAFVMDETEETAETGETMEEEEEEEQECNIAC
jgi:hypothetical protein